MALYDGTNSGLAGYLDVARETGADVTIPVAAAAWPSGPATADLPAAMPARAGRAGRRGALTRVLRAWCTGDLVTSDEWRPREGRIREIAPDIPVAVTLDMHANLYDDMVRHATVISGYHTYPHVDIHAAAAPRASWRARSRARSGP